MHGSDIKAFTRTYAATDDVFLSTGKTYTSDDTALELATASGTATFYSADGLYAHNITITSTVDLSGWTLSVVGVRLDGTTVTEAITGPNNTTVSGTVLFKSVSAINSTGGPTGMIAVGIGHKFGLPPTRLKGYRLVYGTDDGTVTFKDGNGGTTGELKMTWQTEAAPSGVPHTESDSLPGNGMHFHAGMEVALTSGIRSITLYHA